MAEINIFSLGGLQEDGKNLYVVEINKRKRWISINSGLLLMRFSLFIQ